MSLPTLLKPGSILPQLWMTDAQIKKLETQQPIDWIIDYLAERSWTGTTHPKIPITGPGSRVAIFRSGMGTGKSTMIPPAIHTKFYKELNVRKTIICTQPTIVTTIDIPFQITLYNKNMILGQNIGYQYGALARRPISGVLFATIGILLQHLKLLKDEEFMRKYSFVVLDEAHLRSVEFDSVLFFLRNLLERNYKHPECPFVILMSGTLEPDVYMRYFKCPKDSFLDITGTSYPIKDHFPSFDIADYLSYSMYLIEKIHIEEVADITDNKLFRDILLFVQGANQIKEITARIHKLNARVFSKGMEYAKTHLAEQRKKYGGAKSPAAPKQYYICPVSITSDNIQIGAIDYQNLQADIETVTVPIYEYDIDGKITDKILEYAPASRRVIIATNAVETGITIDTLKYCIDTGLVNESQFNPNFGCSALISKNVTQANSRQRRGRVGRKDSGVFYTCYKKETYESMTSLPFPEIIKTDPTLFVLDTIINKTGTTLTKVDNITPASFQMNQFDQWWYELKYVEHFKAQDLHLMQYPSADGMAYGLEKLYGLGFIDHEYKPTLFGYFGSKFRKITIENVRMILAGYQYGANILDLITIVCFMQAGHKLGIKKKKYVPRNPLDLPSHEADNFFKFMFADEFIEYLFIWNDFMKEVEKISMQVEKQSTGGKPMKKSTKKSTKQDTSKIGKLISHLPNWANENHFNYEILSRIVEARDEIIGDLLNIGLNPYYNGLDLPRGKYNLVQILQRNLSEGIDEIRKIKHCIYEGYRFNLFLWDEEAKSYVSHYGHYPVVLDSKILAPIKADDSVKQIRPQKIIISSVMLQSSNIRKGLYDFVGADVSVFDGYVDVDLEFMMH
jgi:HrpA-like RNA helicase